MSPRSTPAPRRKATPEPPSGCAALLDNYKIDFPTLFKKFHDERPLKIVLLGPKASGKTATMTRLQSDFFLEPYYPTTQTSEAIVEGKYPLSVSEQNCEISTGSRPSVAEPSVSRGSLGSESVFSDASSMRTTSSAVTTVSGISSLSSVSSASSAASSSASAFGSSDFHRFRIPANYVTHRECFVEIVDTPGIDSEIIPSFSASTQTQTGSGSRDLPLKSVTTIENRTLVAVNAAGAAHPLCPVGPDIDVYAVVYKLDRYDYSTDLITEIVEQVQKGNSDNLANPDLFRSAVVCAIRASPAVSRFLARKADTLRFLYVALHSAFSDILRYYKRCGVKVSRGNPLGSLKRGKNRQALGSLDTLGGETDEYSVKHSISNSWKRFKALEQEAKAREALRAAEAAMSSQHRRKKYGNVRHVPPELERQMLADYEHLKLVYTSSYKPYARFNRGVPGGKAVVSGNGSSSDSDKVESSEEVSEFSAFSPLEIPPVAVVVNEFVHPSRELARSSTSGLNDAEEVVRELLADYEREKLWEVCGELGFETVDVSVSSGRGFNPADQYKRRSNLGSNVAEDYLEAVHSRCVSGGNDTRFGSEELKAIFGMIIAERDLCYYVKSVESSEGARLKAEMKKIVRKFF